MDLVIEWFKSNQNKLVLGIGISIVSLFIVFYAFKVKKPHSLSDYLQATIDFSKWEANSEEQQNFKRLETDLNKHGELHEKFDAMIVQRLLSKDRLNSNDLRAEKVLNRVESSAPYHALFGKISLLTASKDYEQALKESVALKEIILKDQTLMQNHRILHIFNLMRIAAINQALGHSKEEFAALDELEGAIVSSNEEMSINAGSLIRDKNLSLLDYIRYRRP